MNWGSAAELIGAVGSIAAAGGALYLLKREGEDRRELQRSEIRRESRERRSQASRVHLSEVSPGVRGTSGANRWGRYVVRVENASDGVLNHVFLTIFRNPEVFSVMDDLVEVFPLGRMMPGQVHEQVVEVERPLEAWEERKLAVDGADLYFTDAVGTLFHINREHDLTEVANNPHVTGPA